jgi:hypothetical protein
MTVKTTSHSWFARQGSPEVFITYRTHGHDELFRRKGLLARPLLGSLLRLFGRVRSVDPTAPGGPMVGFDTQKPRHLVTGGGARRWTTPPRDGRVRVAVDHRELQSRSSFHSDDSRSCVSVDCGHVAPETRAPLTAAECSARYHRDGRARRGASGALYPQSAPAGLNPLPRSGIADPARARRR